jgi:arginyl-tRNA synthetase
MKDTLRAILEATISSLRNSGQLNFEEKFSPLVVLESTCRSGQGDYSSSVCLKLASASGQSAQDIGEIIAAQLRGKVSEWALLQLAAPGFLSFKLTEQALLQILKSAYSVKIIQSSASRLQCAQSSLTHLGNCDHRDQKFFSRYTVVFCLRLLDRACSFSHEQSLEIHHAQPVDEFTWTNWLDQFRNDEQCFAAAFLDPESSSLARKIIIAIDESEDFLNSPCGSKKSAHFVRRAHELSQAIHKFIGLAPLFIDDQPLLRARLGIVYATTVILEKLLEKSEAHN